jgi:hypothetical protein
MSSVIDHWCVELELPVLHEHPPLFWLAFWFATVVAPSTEAPPIALPIPPVIAPPIALPMPPVIAPPSP